MTARIVVLALAGTCGPSAPPTSAPVDAPPAVRSEAAEPSARGEDASRFHRVAEVTASYEEEDLPHFRLFEAADEELFATVGPQVMRIAPDGTLERDPSWLDGIRVSPQEDTVTLAGSGPWEVMAAGSRWPDGFFITISAESGARGESNPHEVYRRADDRWVPVANAGNRFHWFPADLAPWKDGSVLALRGFEPVHHHKGTSGEPTAASSRRAAAAIAREPTLVVLSGHAKAPALRRDVAAIDALGTGEIVGVVEGDTPVAVHFDPDRGATIEHALPARALADAEVIVVGPSEAWIYGRVGADPVVPFLARFDGEAWIEQPTPECDGDHAGLGSFTRARDGDTWAVCGYPPDVPLYAGGDRSLWHRSGDDGPWEAIVLPDGATPTQVVARSRDDVWVAGDVLFHTRRRDRVVSVPGNTGAWLDMLERREPVPAFSCTHGTMLVEGAPSGGHADLVAALDRALSGVEHDGLIALVEVSFRGEQRLAIQNHLSPGKAIAERVRQVLGDRMRETYCVFREPTRELDSW